jgi:hypothetical protein
MPIQINFLRYSPENDPSFNEKSRKILMEYLSKRDGLLKKHGVKMLGSWAVPAEHLYLSAVEGSLDAIQKFMMEPESIATTAYATWETKVALSGEEAAKMLKKAK